MPVDGGSRARMRIATVRLSHLAVCMHISGQPGARVAHRLGLSAARGAIRLRLRGAQQLHHQLGAAQVPASARQPQRGALACALQRIRPSDDEQRSNATHMPGTEAGEQ